jgi:hypothetical protein
MVVGERNRAPALAVVASEFNGELAAQLLTLDESPGEHGRVRNIRQQRQVYGRELEASFPQDMLHEANPI